MATRGTSETVPRALRRYLAALAPPETLLVLQHDIDRRDVAEPDLEGRRADLYRRITSAAASCGLDELGVPLPRGRKDPVAYAWGDAAVRLLELPGVTRATSALDSSDVMAFRDHPHTTFLFVASDAEGSFPKDLLVWGPDADACASAVESTLESFRALHPVAGDVT